jgi:hypothetical protein
MLLIALLLAAFQTDAADVVADWSCAGPLVEKNHSQRVHADRLARRIHNLCVRPYVSRSESYMAETRSLLEAQQRAIYSQRSILFQREIAQRISDRRVEDQIPLRR